MRQLRRYVVILRCERDGSDFTTYAYGYNMADAWTRLKNSIETPGGCMASHKQISIKRTNEGATR